jgi:hypothetical protein
MIEGDLVEAFAILKLLADGEDVSCYRDDSRRLVSLFRKAWLANKLNFKENTREDADE